MEKRTFLGIDITPRWELWAEIKRLGKQIEIQERHLAEYQKTLESTKSKSAQKSKEVDSLRAKLARYKPQRDKGGRFAKKN